jgi:hypothetical protein
MASWQSNRAAVAVNTRHHGPNDARTLAARRELRVARAEAYIKQLVDDAPPLTPEQRDRLALLLRPSSGAAA